MTSVRHEISKSQAETVWLVHVQCCFTYTETVRITTETPRTADLDFHTAPDANRKDGQTNLCNVQYSNLRRKLFDCFFFSVALRSQRPNGLLQTPRTADLDFQHSSWALSRELSSSSVLSYVHRETNHSKNRCKQKRWSNQPVKWLVSDFCSPQNIQISGRNRLVGSSSRQLYVHRDRTDCYSDAQDGRPLLSHSSWALSREWLTEFVA